MTTQEHMGRIVETLLFSDKICDKMRQYAIRRVVEEHEAGHFAWTSKVKDSESTPDLLNRSFYWEDTKEGHDWWAVLSFRIFNDADLDERLPSLKKICRTI